MTKRLCALLCSLVLMVAIATTILSSERATAQATAPVGATSHKWEYRVLRMASRDSMSVQAEANSLGDQGFELIKFDVSQFDGSATVTYHIVFRRPKP